MYCRFPTVIVNKFKNLMECQSLAAKDLAAFPLARRLCVDVHGRGRRVEGSLLGPEGYGGRRRAGRARRAGGREARRHSTTYTVRKHTICTRKRRKQNRGAGAACAQNASFYVESDLLVEEKNRFKVDCFPVVNVCICNVSVPVSPSLAVCFPLIAYASNVAFLSFNC